jgi:hypothetical protein
MLVKLALCFFLMDILFPAVAYVVFVVDLCITELLLYVSKFIILFFHLFAGLLSTMWMDSALTWLVFFVEEQTVLHLMLPRLLG